MSVTRVHEKAPGPGFRPFSAIADACRPPKGFVLIDRVSFEATVKARGKPPALPVESRVLGPPVPKIAIAKEVR